METPDDLRFFFTNEKEVATFLAKASGIPNLGIMTARLRAAWYEVSQHTLTLLADETRSDIASLDDMLDDRQLDSMKQDFWERYKMVYPPEVMPADSLISRCYNEISRRRLSICDIHGVNNLAHQATSIMEIEEAAASSHGEQSKRNKSGMDAAQYLDKLHTYLLALALAGTDVLSTQRSESEASIGRNARPPAHVPLNTVMQYFWKAKTACQAQPQTGRLEWLEKQDILERAQWTAAFRDSQDTLGVVIYNTMELQEDKWAGEEALSSSAVTYGIQEREPEVYRPYTGDRQQGSLTSQKGSIRRLQRQKTRQKRNKLRAEEKSLPFEEKGCYVIQAASTESPPKKRENASSDGSDSSRRLEDEEPEV